MGYLAVSRRRNCPMHIPLNTEIYSLVPFIFDLIHDLIYENSFLINLL